MAFGPVPAPGTPKPAHKRAPSLLPPLMLQQQGPLDSLNGTF